LYPTFLEAFGFDAPELELSERDLEAAITTAREPRPWEAEVPLPLAEASFPVLVVQGAWDVAPPGPREISATALHAICDVLVERLGAESAVFSGAMHNPQLLGAPFNDRLRELLRPTRPCAVGASRPAESGPIRQC
jgi:pimeloyl-ACP methyl ester carboxylesterase